MSQKDKYSIVKKQIQEVLRFSQGYDFEPNVDNMFEKWKENKAAFINAWDGKFIYEFPNIVNFSLDEQSKTKEISNFIDKLCSCGFRDLAQFVWDCKEGFFDNIVTNDIIIKNFLGEIVLNIPKGAKLTKSFKFFLSDEGQLREVQDWASQVIQKNKISGKICLSIHPLDFLSSSENLYNWRSCHALDGEYRAGNISYMVDSSTVICYLKSEEPAILPDFPKNIAWNNKKWRMLLHFSLDKSMLFAGRQYPFSSQEILKFLSDVLLTSGKLGEWTNWTNYKIRNLNTQENELGELQFPDPLIPVGRTLKRLGLLVKDEKGSYHYNDVLHSSCYDPQYCYRKSKEHWKWGDLPTGASLNTTKFVIGGVAKCVHCGEEKIGCRDGFLCQACDQNYSQNDWVHCSDCGVRIHPDDVYYLANGDLVCPSCVQSDRYALCAHCHEYYPIAELSVDMDNGLYYCRYHSNLGRTGGWF